MHFLHNSMREIDTFNKMLPRLLGGWHFLTKGVPNLQKAGIDKTATPLFRQQKFYDPHHRYTLPPKQAKIVLKSVFLNKINTLSVVILWLPTFWSSKSLWPPYFSFQKFMKLPKENASPLKRIRSVILIEFEMLHQHLPSNVKAGAVLGFKIEGRGWPLEQPEIQKWGSKCRLLRVITCSGIPQCSKKRGH